MKREAAKKGKCQQQQQQQQQQRQQRQQRQRQQQQKKTDTEKKHNDMYRELFGCFKTSPPLTTTNSNVGNSVPTIERLPKPNHTVAFDVNLPCVH